MSLYGALSSGVSGVNAFSTEMAIRADNVANSATIGYKKGKVDFSTLVSDTNGGGGNYASGGVISSYRATIDTSGTISSSDYASDLAVSGNGFFVVNTALDGTGEYLYTRAGAFRSNGNNYVNAAGYTLLGWPLDSEGRLPGDNGNVNATPSALLSSLEPVNIKSINGSSSPTTILSIKANLNETEKVFKGAGETISFRSLALANYDIGSIDPISPENSGTNVLNVDDVISLTPSDPGTTYNFVYGGISRSDDIAGGILGTNTAQNNFTGANDGDNFTISSGGVTTTYTYKSSAPSSSKGEFNTPNSLIDAINQTAGFRARIASDGGSTRIIVTPKDANQAMTFADITGTFVTSLGFTDTTLNAAGNRFSSLSGLAKIINESSGVSASILNPSRGATLSFYASDPLGRLTVSATGSGVAPGIVSTAASVLSEFGLNTTPATIFGPAYDSTNSNLNMAGGKLESHFSRTMQVYDAFGTGHNIKASFLKTGINTWAVEVHAQNPDELISNRTDGQIASGNISFNGDGSLKSISPNLSNPLIINWTNESMTSSIAINWGTAGEVEGTPGATLIGQKNGLRQLDSEYNVESIEQNGTSVSALAGVSFKDGYVVASFMNGSSKKLFQLPLADFANPNGLQDRGGNAYSETIDSGNFNLKSSGTGGIGTIKATSLEQSNVDLAEELTSIIVTQRNYQSASKIIKVADSMLEELNRLIT